MTPVVEELLGRMSITEKVGQVNQRLLGWKCLRKTRSGFVLTDEAKQEIDRWGGLGALYGLFRADAWSGQHWGNGIRPEERHEAAAAMQEAVRIRGSGLGVLLSEEAPHGHQALGSTLLPVNLAVAASWDVEAVREATEAVAEELAASGVHLALVSALDVLRDPRWGRSEECFGEDPQLAAAMTRAVTEGMQGEQRSRVGSGGVAVVLKHLAAQGEAVGGRNGQSAVIGTRDLTEIHLPPVEAGLAAGALGFMAAYNDIDGVPCCANEDLLTHYLRAERGFDGLVMADGLAVDRLEAMTGSLTAAAREALLAGVDLSLWDESYTMLAELAESDPQVLSSLDVACARVLTMKERFGLVPSSATNSSLAVVEESFELVDAERSVSSSISERSVTTLVGAGARAELASRRLAQESLVLLTNRDHRSMGGSPGACLPLDPGSLKRVAVVGRFAADVPALLGDYVPPLPENSVPSIATSLQAALPDTRVAVSEEPNAAEVAQADVVVAVVGGTSHRSYSDTFAANGAIQGRSGAATCGEGVDLADLRLLEQEAMLTELRGLVGPNVPIVVVLVAGRPHVLTGVVKIADAVLWAGYPGPYGAEAIADTLLGRSAPTGRLPMTLPRYNGASPVRYNDRHSAAGVYQDADQPVLFPFGHGLSYSSVDITGLEARVGAEHVNIHIVVGNTSRQDVQAVIPVFARRFGGRVVPRLAELIAFARSELAAGAHTDLMIAVPLDRVFADPRDPQSMSEIRVDDRHQQIHPM